jgi:GST-like protein
MIQLYSLATPNGQKISVALEELGLDYTPHTVNILKGEQFTPEFVALNPNSKIPAIVDEDGPNEEAISIMESGAILLYLAEKTGRLMSQDSLLRLETIQWVFFQMASIGPMFGQFGHFYKYAGERCNHPYPLERYTTEAKRLLAVLETRLQDRTWLVGDAYSIADIAIFPWVHCLGYFYKAGDHLDLSSYVHVQQWLERCLQRPATERGMKVCSDI